MSTTETQIDDPQLIVSTLAAEITGERRSELRSKLKKQEPFPASEQSLCAFTQIAWVPTTSGMKTMREVYEQAHQIEGFDPTVTGIEYSTLVRMFASTTALLMRGKKVRQRYEILPVGERFAVEDIDRLQEIVQPHMDLFHPVYPFLQRPTNVRVPLPVASLLAKPGILYPWYQKEEVAHFFDRIEPPKEFDIATAVMALSVFMTHSVSSNKRLPGKKSKGEFNGSVKQGDHQHSYGQFFGSPGYQEPGRVGSETAVEIMFGGESLFETMLLTTPKSWVTGGGLPAWMDLGAKKSMARSTSMPPLWRQTWFPNQVVCLWNDTKDKLVNVQTGGGAPLPPGAFFEKTKGSGKNKTVIPVPVPQESPWDMGIDDKRLKKEWSDALSRFQKERAIEDPFYYWEKLVPVKQKPGAKPNYRALRPNLNGTIKETLASWYKDKAMDVLFESTRSFVIEPSQYDYVTFLSHKVGGQTASRQVRSSRIFTDKVNVWAPEDLPVPFAAASETIGKVVNAMESIWFERDASGKTAKRDLDPATARQKARAMKIFWHKISSRLPDFLSEESATDTPEFWQTVRTVAFEAYDEATRAYSTSAGVHRAEARRARLSAYLHNALENYL